MESSTSHFFLDNIEVRFVTLCRRYRTWAIKKKKKKGGKEVREE